MHCCIRVQLVHVAVQISHVLPTASRLVQEPRELTADLDVLVDKRFQRVPVKLVRRNHEPDVLKCVTYILPRVNNSVIGSHGNPVAETAEPAPQINVIHYAPL